MLFRLLTFGLHCGAEKSLLTRTQAGKGTRVARTNLVAVDDGNSAVQVSQWPRFNYQILFLPSQFIRHCVEGVEDQIRTLARLPNVGDKKATRLNSKSLTE